MSNEKIEFLSAILLISKNHHKLASFYKDIVGIPLIEEQHDETIKHYGCEVGDIHFAIHPQENFPDKNNGVGSIKLAFNVFDIKSFVNKVELTGYKFEYTPKNLGYAIMTALYDPDGNYLEFTQLSDLWFKRLDNKKVQGFDIVHRWKKLNCLSEKMQTPISHSNFINVKPERVYETLTTAEGWNSWFTKGMVLDFRIDGVIHFKWNNWGPDQVTTEDEGVITDFEHNKRFCFQWHPQGKENPTLVKFTLEPKVNGTHLKLEETGYLNTNEGHRIFNSCASGWGEAMTLLKFYLESGLTYTQIDIK